MPGSLKYFFIISTLKMIELLLQTSRYSIQTSKFIYENSYKKA